MDKIGLIKAHVSMREVVEHYGFRMSFGSFINCPFHNDKKPSMKIYQSSFRCYVCEEYGDVIDFVARYNNTDVGGAFQIFQNEFGVPLDMREYKAKKTINKKKEKRDKINNKLEQVRSKRMFLSKEYRKHFQNQKKYKPKNQFELENIPDCYAEAINCMPLLELKFKILDDFESKLLEKRYNI